MNEITDRHCANCGSAKQKAWRELGEEERTIVRRLPSEIGVGDEEREGRMFCARCLYRSPAGPADV